MPETKLVPLSEDDARRIHRAVDFMAAKGGANVKFLTELAGIARRFDDGLDGAECHELFSAYLANGPHDDIHPQHPIRTGAAKLAEYQDEHHPRFSTPVEPRDA